MGGTRLASCLIIFLHLLLVMFGEASEGLAEVDDVKRENPIIRMVTKMEENSQEIDQQQQNQPHSEHMNPKLMVFFTMNDLKQGKKLPIYFPKRDPSKSPPLLPKEKADTIPFSLNQLPQILNSFSFPSDSPQAQAVKETLQQCQRKPIKGETKFCATSMESMVGFVRTTLGAKSKTNFKFITTSHLTKTDLHFQNYTFFKPPKQIPAPRLVACHTMPYPYAVYYCHYQEGDNNVLQISLKGENGDRVQALAVCHMDTSQWSPTHPSFQILKVQPGTIPVCHFFPADDFVWIPVNDA